MFAVDASDGWADITGEIESPDVPPTLARRDGVGALQFTIALYEGGVVPDPSPDDLRGMVERFAENRGLKPISPVLAEAGLAAGSFAWEADAVRVWVVSDGRSFAYVTHVCDVNDAATAESELADCERIVRGIAFDQGREDRGLFEPRSGDGP